MREVWQGPHGKSRENVCCKIKTPSNCGGFLRVSERPLQREADFSALEGEGEGTEKAEGEVTPHSKPWASLLLWSGTWRDALLKVPASIRIHRNPPALPLQGLGTPGMRLRGIRRRKGTPTHLLPSRALCAVTRTGVPGSRSLSRTAIPNVKYHKTSFLPLSARPQPPGQPTKALAAAPTAEETPSAGKAAPAASCPTPSGAYLGDSGSQPGASNRQQVCLWVPRNSFLPSQTSPGGAVLCHPGSSSGEGLLHELPGPFPFP